MSDEEKNKAIEPADASAQELKDQAAATSRPPRSEAVVNADGTANAPEAGAAPVAVGDSGAASATEASPREARARERAARKTAEEGAAQTPKEPSPEQPRLDRLVQIIKENIAEDAVEAATVNELSKHLPTVYVKSAYWDRIAPLLRDHDELQLHYLRNVTGIDAETHFEVAYHLLSLVSKHDYCLKVKTDREQPAIPSVALVWSTANWHEREIFDLLGIDFPGHPDLRRIMLSDDWEGHPLRKDYVPVDPEV